MSEPSRGPAWQRIRDLEDALALLEEIDDHRRVARVQLWRQGDLVTAYAEVTAIGRPLAALKRTLSERWHELMSEVNRPR